MLLGGRVGLCVFHQRLASGSKYLPLIVYHHRNMSSTGSTQLKRPISLLGSMAFGERADAETSTKMVKAYLERGHNDLDTAFMYTDGQAETIIGGMNLPKTGNEYSFNSLLSSILTL